MTTSVPLLEMVPPPLKAVMLSVKALLVTVSVPVLAIALVLSDWLWANVVRVMTTVPAKLVRPPLTPRSVLCAIVLSVMVTVATIVENATVAQRDVDRDGTPGNSQGPAVGNSARGGAPAFRDGTPGDSQGPAVEDTAPAEIRAASATERQPLEREGPICGHHEEAKTREARRALR